MKNSIDYANQRSYLDDLFRVYPCIPEGIRDIDEDVWSKVEKSYKKKDNESLIANLLKLDLFPIKDSYVAYLRRDKKAIERNPETIDRLCGRIYEMGLPKLFEKCSEPKETNRKIGPLFKDWVKTKALGKLPVPLDEFANTSCNAILDANDKEMKDFAREQFGYKRDKGLDFVARFNGKYVIGEAKFLTEIGGHQNAQFNDAISTISATVKKDVIKIAILDGVLYIPSNNKMYKAITQTYCNENIMSALVLREFLYSI